MYGFSFDESSQAMVDSLRKVTEQAPNILSQADLVKATELIAMGEERLVLPNMP